MQGYFSYKNLSIFYTKQGSGEAVVFVHGFGEDGSIWDYQTDFLKDFYTVIVIDLPGSGRSKVDSWELIADTSKHVTNHLSTIEFYADCICALLQHVTITTCTLFGHSMGGYITLAFAEKYSELLQGFGLVHSTAFADTDEKKINRQRGIELMEQYGSYSFLKTTIPNLFSTTYKNNNADKVAALIEAGKRFEVITLQNYYRAMMKRLDKTDVLKGSNKPVLFIIGDQDVAVPIKDSLQQSHMPICSYIHILENVGHMGMWEESDKVNQFLLSFLHSNNY